MKSTETNVLDKSDYYLYTASEYTKQLFFYPICVGQFFYDSNYLIKRDRYDSFLVMMIQEGTVNIKVKGKQFSASQGDVVILDCYKPHCYGSDQPWSTIWMHFDGPMARIQFEHLVKTFGHVIKPRDGQSVEHTFNKIVNLFRDKSNIKDASMSKYITNILTELFLSGFKKNSASKTNFEIEQVLSFINENYVQPLTLEDLAQQCNLSPFHFTRVFSKETGMTPHQYVIATRINSAKFLLKTTKHTIKEIAFECGFNNESVFCNAFKKVEHITPSEYRLIESN